MTPRCIKYRGHMVMLTRTRKWVILRGNREIAAYVPSLYQAEHRVRNLTQDWSGDPKPITVS